MRIVRRSLAVILAVLLVAPAARAGVPVARVERGGVETQTHVIGKAALAKAVADRVSRDRADRDAILSLLQRAEVRTIAAKAGLSVEKAAAAVSTLQGDDLSELASQARQVQNDLAGGASTIVISTTTIIIVLLLIILIVALVD
jgi:hypothetical protein